MALFGTPTAFLGLDVGSSSIKIVELIDRKKRIEVTTYGQAELNNLLIHPPSTEDEALSTTANAVRHLMEKAHVTTEAVVAALPSSIVFSTVVTLPDMSETEMDKAVHFAARDVVPANLDDMVVGWSRLGQQPRMDSPIKKITDPVLASPAASPPLSETTLPIFVTAAPKAVVNRYVRLSELSQLHLQALEVETFPLIRSLLSQPTSPALLVDMGDTVTTFHIVDRSAARLTHSIDYGGKVITTALSKTLAVSESEAEQKKIEFGLIGAPDLQRIIRDALQEPFQQSKRLLERYSREESRAIRKIVLIGGSANLKGLASAWSEFLGVEVAVGNPWRGLSYPQELEARLTELGPEYAVAVGLALRGFTQV